MHSLIFIASAPLIKCTSEIGEKRKPTRNLNILMKYSQPCSPDVDRDDLF
jgi:hypothetical protein